MNKIVAVDHTKGRRAHAIIPYALAIGLGLGLGVGGIAAHNHINRDACIDRNLTALDQMTIQSVAEDLCSQYRSYCRTAPHKVDLVARRIVCDQKGLR